MTQSKEVKQWCEKHWATVREGVEAKKMNGLAASVIMAAYLLNNDIVMQRLGWDEEKGTKATHDPAIMNMVMAEIAPHCCWLGDTIMERLYKQITYVGGQLKNCPGQGDNPYEFPKEWITE